MSEQVRLLMARALVVGVMAESHDHYEDLCQAYAEFRNQPSDPYALGVYVWATIVEDTLSTIMDQVGTKDMESQHGHE